VRALDEAIIRRAGAETAAKDRIAVRLLGGLTLIRVVADRGELHTELDLPLDQELWFEPLESIAEKLFPEAAVLSPVVVETPPPPPERERSLTPFVVLGASAVVAVTGIAFGIASKNANDASQLPGVDDERFDRLADRKTRYAITADLLFLAALAGGGVGVWLLASE
jgi:hypothetical protein